MLSITKLILIYEIYDEKCILDGMLCLGWNIEEISRNNTNVYYVWSTLTVYSVLVNVISPKTLVINHSIDFKSINGLQPTIYRTVD